MPEETILKKKCCLKEKLREEEKEDQRKLEKVKANLTCGRHKGISGGNGKIPEKWKQIVRKIYAKQMSKAFSAKIYSYKTNT